MRKKILPFLLIFVFVLILYYPVLSTYFSQDDFFHFKVSHTDGSILGFIKLFGIYSFKERGIAFYRPISREIPFNIFYNLFGLNAIPFRTFTFLIYLFNIYLVYLLVQILFNRKYLSYFVSFFFGVTAANVATLYYLAGGIQTLLATTFTLASLLFFQKYLKSSKNKFRLLSFLSFLLGISSHEQAIIIPFLIIGLLLIYKPKKMIKEIYYIILLFIIITLLIYLEITRIGFSSSEQEYQAVFNIKTAVNSLFWYSNWALGIPETLIDFVSPGFRLNPTLLRYWGIYYAFIFPSYFISIASIFVAIIYLFIKNRVIFVNKLFVLSLVWFPLALLPVILFPLHKSTHYLAIALPAFWTIIGYITFSFYQQVKIKNKSLANLFTTLLIINFIILSSSSAILGSTNYWAATRGKLAKQLITEVKNTYPTLPKGSIIYFKNDPTYPFLIEQWGRTSKQASLILNGNEALQLLYKDFSLKVFYEDFGTIPKEFTKQRIFSIMAKII